MIPVFIHLFTSLLYPPALTQLSVPGALVVSRAGWRGFSINPAVCDDEEPCAPPVQKRAQGEYYQG